MKIFIILFFQIWIISVYSSDLSYFDFLLNENKTNNPNKDIITEDNPENIPNDGITNDKTKHNHAFNLMFKQIEHNFDNISAEIEFFLSKSKN